MYMHYPVETYEDLCFGIISPRMDVLVPKDAEQSFATLFGYNQVADVKRLAQHGFRVVELNTDITALLLHALPSDSLEGLIAVKEEVDVAYTVHLPILTIEPTSHVAAVRQGAVQATVDAIRALEPLAPERYVYHVSGEMAARFMHSHISHTTKLMVMRALQQYARESLAAVLDQTRINPQRLAIETIQFPFDMTLELANEFDTGVCFDTAHVLVGYAGPIDFIPAFEQTLPRLCEIHLNDGPWQGPNHVVQQGKDHLPLGSGDLDVAWFINRCIEIQFDGPVIFELSLDEAMRSLDVIRAGQPQTAQLLA
jgi:sugar phosphate isomerase/epimerase